MKLRRGLLAGLFALIMSLVLAPAAFADKNLQLYGVTDEPFYQVLGQAYATQQTNTFYLAGELPPGLTVHQSSDGHLDSFILEGTPTERGTYIFEAYWYKGSTSVQLDYFYVVVTIYGKPAVTIYADKWDLDVGEVAKLYTVTERGSGHYSYIWYVEDANHNWAEIGSDLDWLPYPTSGTLTLADDGKTFKVAVEDLDTGFWGESVPAQITLTCDHKYSAWTVETPATCTEDEMLVRTCSKCGRVDYQYGEAAKGHTWGTWSEETAATCTDSQVLVRTCSECGLTDHKMGVGATGHTWGTWSALGDTKMTHTCTVCGATEVADIVAGVPFVKVQPTGGSIFTGETHGMSVEAEASGLGELAYQWMVCASPGGVATPAPGASAGTSYQTDTEGYYFVRITQTAGAAANTVDSGLAYVHVHALGAWVVDEAAGTVMRECTSPNCGLTESYTFAEFRAAYPSEAKELGLSPFSLFYRQHTGLFWGLVAGAALILVAVVVLIVLIVQNKKLRRAQRVGAGAPGAQAGAAGAQAGTASSTGAAGSHARR